jgi:hypothetical protein
MRAQILILAIMLVSSIVSFPNATADPSIHPPIKIIGNAGLGVGCTPNLANGVRAGCGTSSSPYVIENWLIDGAITPDPWQSTFDLFVSGKQGGLYVEGTTAYLTIRNLTVRGFPLAEVHLRAASNVRIESLMIATTPGSVVGDRGVYINGGSNIQVSSTTFQCNLGWLPIGIQMLDVATSSVSENTFNGCALGFHSTSASVNVSGNTFSGGQRGISVSGANHVLHGNTITGMSVRGIEFTGGVNATISHNLVTNNTGIGIYTGSSGAHVDDNIVSYNSGGGIDIGGGTSTYSYSGNNIFGNSNYGLRTCSSNVLNWTNNWWGDSSGPSGLGSGSGDAVTKCLAGAQTPSFSPWFTSENSSAGP